ncbi:MULTISPECIES: SDR family NAD(P)-dependent oxidoreductase [unclassified Streptomyces]|uniref:SDR family NAD(P)-dependent oxidoreductase n=1 Tax=unclassified Streptomyces TaxID=2593676 RepID=UPI00342F43F3
MSEQVWFVTGSSRGLGRAVVEEALVAGHRVVATARRPEVLADLEEKYGDQMRTLALDVSDAGQAARTVQAGLEAFGRLDVVVNNAGYANLAPVEEVDPDDFRTQIETVFFGTVHVTKAALPVFRRQGAGHFIQVTSIGGRMAFPGASAYHAAKFAVEGFSKVLAKETANLGVKVTIAEPGAMRTDYAGSSMDIPAHAPYYADTVGEVATILRSGLGQEPIDPAKVARVFLDIARMQEPPLHLVLGADAVDMISGGMRELAAADARWADLGHSVDFG